MTNPSNTINMLLLAALSMVLNLSVVVQAEVWTWVSGAATGGQPNVYGTKGVPASGNVPGGRQGCVSWIDSSGNMWLFGGQDDNIMNDLWKFDGTNWTWVSGSNIGGQYGVYGTKGVPSPSNVPGARLWSVSWIDNNGELWLFGGDGRDINNFNYSFLNDLWKFDGTNWTWISGSNICKQSGVYGTKGIPGPNAVPGARWQSTSWKDSSGNLWLFGGWGYNNSGNQDWLNDLWKFDGTNWTWVSGSNIGGQYGVYGTKGVPASGNVPGGRQGCVSWIDSSGNMWLFGGSGLAASKGGCLNDLWKFDGTDWTWVNGSNICNQSGVYGTKGVRASTNVPGARYVSVSWIDKSGHLWLFGGQGYDRNGTQGRLNDLWKFDGTDWTWVNGSNICNQSGVYGTKGVRASTNVPGARSYSISWIDKSGSLWLFAGDGYDVGSKINVLNDLWKFDDFKIITGDIDGDGTVDFADFTILASHWLESQGPVEPVRIVSFSLDMSPNWTTEGQWEFGNPVGMGGSSHGYPDPNNGFTGQNVYGINLNGDYTVAVGGPYRLTAGPFDCNGYENVELNFARWLNTDTSVYVKCVVEISNNGSNWQEIWVNPADTEIADNQWQQLHFDISSIADRQATVYIRWSYQILSDRSYPYSGWNIDDVELQGEPN
jgi:hypothetical protein